MEEFPKVRKPYGSKLISIRIYEDMTDHHISVERAELLCERLRAVLEAQRLQVSDGEILAFSGTVDEKVLFSSLAGEHPDPVPESVLEVDILESQAKINAFVSGKIDEIQTRIKRIDAKQGAMDDEAAVCLKLLKRHSRWAHGENQVFLKRMSALEEKASDSLPGSGGGCGDCDMCRHGDHCDGDCEDECVFVCDASRCDTCQHSSLHHNTCKAGSVFEFAEVVEVGDLVEFRNDDPEMYVVTCTGSTMIHTERVCDCTGPWRKTGQGQSMDIDMCRLISKRCNWHGVGLPDNGRRCIIYKHEHSDDDFDTYIGIRGSRTCVPWYSRIEDARKFANERDAVAYALGLGIVDRFVKGEVKGEVKGDGDGEEIGVGDLVSRGGSDRWVVLAVGHNEYTVLCVVEDTESIWDVGDRFDSCDSFKLIAKAGKWGS